MRERTIDKVIVGIVDKNTGNKLLIVRLNPEAVKFGILSTGSTIFNYKTLEGTRVPAENIKLIHSIGDVLCRIIDEESYINATHINTPMVSGVIITDSESFLCYNNSVNYDSEKRVLTYNTGNSRCPEMTEYAVDIADKPLFSISGDNTTIVIFKMLPNLKMLFPVVGNDSK